MTLLRKNYPHLANPAGAYVHSVKHNGLLYISGMTAFGTIAQGRSMAEQATEIFHQIASIVQAENSSFADLIKITIFVTDISQLSTLRDVMYKFYGANLPASSLVEVKGLFSPEINIEIETLFAINPA
ncbi:RidA family protein [Yersinia sp. 2466 StPb PI]|uniref:RidA family protein n=1 Tax=Yersinia sp. 2466 StPb PI TaxID=3061648 RepID=UPI0009F2D0B6|nr:RidA family protein [Yersinia enterocolitica]